MSSDDPLQLWLRGIEESRTPEAQAQALERCVGALVGTERYRDDVRFLRLALQHVRARAYVSSPSDARVGVAEQRAGERV